VDAGAEVHVRSSIVACRARDRRGRALTKDRKTALFFELFSGLPRQGPGDTASTLKALALVPGIGPNTRVLDLGCGTGGQTRVLARHSAHVLAIDNHPPYIDELNREADALGIADRIDARVGDMRELDVADASCDLIWCESAIYVVGFEAALRSWRRLLAPGGHLAVSEVCWTRPDPPRECAAFWDELYPSIRDVPSLLATIAACGYETVGHFMLPTAAWWDSYYGPLERNLDAFERRYPSDPDARDLSRHVRREIDTWRVFATFYGYAFFVMRERRSV
jgi:SAM-dependent methyltransferase